MTVDPSLVVSIVALAGAGLAWLLADARQKGRIDTLEPKVTKLETSERAAALQAAALENECKNLRLECQRLDAQKADLVLVQGIANLIRDFKADFERTLQSMKEDIDRRFDRLERLERGNGNRDP